MVTLAHCAIAAGLRPELPTQWITGRSLVRPPFGLDRPPTRRAHDLPAGAAVYFAILNVLVLAGLKFPVADLISRSCVDDFGRQRLTRTMLTAIWRAGHPPDVALLPAATFAAQLREGGNGLLFLAIDFDRLVDQVRRSLEMLEGLGPGACYAQNQKRQRQRHFRNEDRRTALVAHVRAIVAEREAARRAWRLPRAPRLPPVVTAAKLMSRTNRALGFGED